MMQSDMEKAGQNDAAFELTFSVAAKQRSEDWEKSHICADYLAKCASQALDGLTDPGLISELHDRVNYVANELLEAAILGQAGSNDKIWIQLQMTDQKILVNTKSNHSAGSAALLEKLARLAEAKNPGALYLDRLETGGPDNSVYSDIRFLSMMVDCDAQIDMVIEDDEKSSKTLSVTTRTSVPVA